MKSFFLNVTLLMLFLFNTPAIVSAHDGPHVTVQASDTLSGIAQRYDTDVTTLRRLNNIANGDDIRIGALLALPNTDEAEPVVADRPVSAVDIASQPYVVQRGDTLSEIAQRYGANLALLVEINRIAPAQQLYAGQTLHIPATSEKINQLLPAEHVVQVGEQLGVIAQRYGLTVTDLLRANQLTNANVILPGQRLRIAGAADNAQATVDNQASQLTAVPAHATTSPTTEKWIDVDLSSQTVVAYEGAVPVNQFIVSSGLPGTPTVTGEFRIWAKTPIQDMYGGNRAAGDYYYLEDVQWVQYFFEDYAFHAAYWHDDFGQPMSRGCVNMRTDDAKWLYDWASPNNQNTGWLMSDAANPGTLVIVHE